ncbi:DUF5060 domain-containing protein [Paenibacillaceae bacterium WGS1546]|uniref:DUF5060 domain-containing protein n=1 Tax=Cohnella sp. WGS1546 TaxID=3366810 RepID=UPI00372CECCA
MIWLDTVERWGTQQIELAGPQEGNPFREVELSAVFTRDDRSLEAHGFYDGEGRYQIRFMPEETGSWHFATKSNVAKLDGLTGTFQCAPASAGNHGPVRVRDTYHFAYADGTPYKPIGTTTYGWAHQQEQLANETLQTLAASPFNKLRMLILPHYSPYSAERIPCYPFAGEAPDKWDFERLNPAYFQMLERRILKLLELGIEADLILMHPYSKEWGFDRMTAETDDFYIRYVINRFGAFRHVWWSVANEFDWVKAKTRADWERMGNLVQQSDLYNRLVSIHNMYDMYENWRPWITHVSMQDGLAVANPGRAGVLRNVYRKPVIYDEVGYEGNMYRFHWGHVEAEELVRRFWRGTVEGTYVGHGEVFHPPGATVAEVFAGIGGVWRGRSIERIGFLRNILEEGPARGIDPIDEWVRVGVAGQPGDYYLIYLGEQADRRWMFEIPSRGADELPPGTRFQVDVIDIWKMTIDPCATVFEIVRKDDYLYKDVYDRYVELPDGADVAIRVTRVTE